MKLGSTIGDGYRQELYAGVGCCCGLNSWRKDVKRREPQLNRELINPIPEIMQIFIRCIATEFISGDKIQLALGRMEDILLQKKYAPDEIKSITNGIVHSFNENRSTWMKGFMG